MLLVLGEAHSFMPPAQHVGGYDLVGLLYHAAHLKGQLLVHELVRLPLHQPDRVGKDYLLRKEPPKPNKAQQVHLHG